MTLIAVRVRLVLQEMKVRKDKKLLFRAYSTYPFHLTPEITLINFNSKEFLKFSYIDNHYSASLVGLFTRKTQNECKWTQT